VVNSQLGNKIVFCLNDAGNETAIAVQHLIL
jgi:hypothetical protein